MTYLIKYIIIKVLEADDIFNKIHYYKSTGGG